MKTQKQRRPATNKASGNTNAATGKGSRKRKTRLPATVPHDGREPREGYLTREIRPAKEQGRPGKSTDEQRNAEATGREPREGYLTREDLEGKAQRTPGKQPKVKIGTARDGMSGRCLALIRAALHRDNGVR